MIKNKKEIVMIITGTILITFAVVIAIYNYYCNACAAENIQKVIPTAEKRLSDYNNVPQAYAQSGKMSNSSELCEAPCLEINGNAYIGVLEIPSLNLTLPILSDYGTKNLDIAPCGCNDPANFIIEGKNYTSHFGQLDSLITGDRIIFTDFLGRIYEYKVLKSDAIFGYEKIKDLSKGYGLTLVCNSGFGSKRFVVFCDKI